MGSIWCGIFVITEELYMSEFLHKNIDTVFIMLGNSCNLNCEYCLQHPLVTKALPKDINPDIYKFLRSISQEQEQIITLQFYGGEPLVYFDTIVDIVNELNTNTDIKFNYSIITNGKLLGENKINFFNKNNFQVTISWDGHMSEDTRHYDVFKNNKSLYNIKKLAISGVLSGYAYPRELLNDFHLISSIYKAKTGRRLGINIDLIMDTSLENRNICNLDMQKLKDDYDYIFKNYKLSREKKFNELDQDYTVTHLYYAMSTYNTVKSRNNYLNNCGNGFNILNLDLEGNLYSCHNTSDSIANIYTPFWEYISNLIRQDNNIQNIKKCNNCDAIGICMGGCKLLSDEVRNRYYCKAKKIIAQSIKENEVSFQNGPNSCTPKESN